MNAVVRARWLPWAALGVIAAAMLLHGPIAQPAGYHDFADARSAFGIARAADVLSNVPFALVALWGLLRRPAGPAWRMFDVALLLTAFGSSYYHLAPDDARLVWDRIPIALACAAMIVAVHAETHTTHHMHALLAAMAVAAVASVVWWRETTDLGPYLLFQAAPLVLVPFWQWQANRPRRERILFGMAFACYAIAKMLEVLDRAVFQALTVVSGHTLKHLFAAFAAALIVEARGAARAD